MVALQQTALAQEVPRLACILAEVDLGMVTYLRDFPGGWVLIGAEKGLFLTREVSGRVELTEAREGGRVGLERCGTVGGVPGRRDADRG